MNIQTILLIILAVLVVIAIGLVVALTALRYRSMKLKQKFGPEYDYTLEKAGDRRYAEAELKDREKRVNELDIHPMSEADKDRYHREWNDIQAQFVDDPLGATQQANRTITEVMISRGFPVEDMEERSEDLSVIYPKFVSGYREANSILSKSHDDGVSTEDLRQAMVKLHSLFDALIDFEHHQQNVMEVNS